MYEHQVEKKYVEKNQHMLVAVISRDLPKLFI